MKSPESSTIFRTLTAQRVKVKRRIPRILSFREAKRRGICISVFFVALLICAAQVNARTKKKLPAHPINLNTATLWQLEQLPGVGPVTAQKILDFRTKGGPFKSVTDLLAVPRISKARFAKIKPYVYVKSPSAQKAAPSHRR